MMLTKLVSSQAYKSKTTRALLLVIGLISTIGWPTQGRAGLDEGKAAIEKGDGNSAIKELLPLAEAGDVKAMYLLGNIYYAGLGFPSDAAKAREFYQQAARKGHIASITNLGMMLRDGVGGPKSTVEAIRFLKTSSNAGDPVAMGGLAEIYLYGLGTSKDEPQAVEWLTKAADLGEPVAQYQLATLHATGGAGLTKNLKKAGEWMEKAAKQGHVLAAHYLGNDAIQRQDAKTAGQWVPLAAAGGVAPAFGQYSMMLLAGWGVPQDQKKGIEFLRAAAKAGIAESQFNLGKMYYEGTLGEKNHVLAYEWVARSQLAFGTRSNGVEAAKSFKAEIAKNLSAEQTREIEDRIRGKVNAPPSAKAPGQAPATAQAAEEAPAPITPGGFTGVKAKDSGF